MPVDCDVWSSASLAAAERRPHEEFVALRSEAVYGRTATQCRVLSHIAGGENALALALRGSGGAGAAALNLEVVQRALVGYLAEEPHRPLVLEGDAGAGKSAIISACTRKVQQLFPHLKLFYHFVGAAPGSTDLVRLLRRLWLELAPDKAMPPSEDALLRGAEDLLVHAGRQGGAVLLIDALNQLDADAELAQLRWLPARLPAGVRCIVSVIGGTRFHELLLERSPPPLRVRVGDLDGAACERLARGLLAGVPRGVVDKGCLDGLLAKRGARNPLWLVSACEELKAAAVPPASQERVQQAIAGFPDDLLGLLQQILARVEKEHDALRTAAALCLLECSRHGLTALELRALLADRGRCQIPDFGGEGADAQDAAVSSASGAATVSVLKGKLHASARTAVQETAAQGTPSQAPLAQAVVPAGAVSGGAKAAGQAALEQQLLPPESWEPIFQGLQPFLRPCGGAGRGGRLDFFHRAVSKAVRLRHFPKAGGAEPEGQLYALWHGRLADFFERCSDAQRRAEELPYHLEKVLDNSRLLRSLVQWDVFSRLATSGHGFELLRFCRAAGGPGAVASALQEQLGLWSAKGSGVADEEVALRKCMVAEFLTKAGQSHHAVRILRDTPGDHGLRAATRARQLGLLADAMLCDACFGTGQGGGDLAQVPGILESAVALWRGTGEEERDEAALAQALSNLCFQYGQQDERERAEDAGREAMDIYSRLRHPRLGQAEQHMAHVLKSKRLPEQAMEMYRQSIATFERTGTAKLDTEHACSLSAIAGMLLEMGQASPEASPAWPAIIAWQRAAVVSCEAFTGRDHVEAAFYRRTLVEFLVHSGNRPEALRIRNGAELAVTPDDVEAMRAHP